MAEVAALGPLTLGFCALAVFLGTVLQRLAGQGFGMIAAPLIALVAPQFLPATLLILGAFVGFSSSAVEIRALNRRELPPGFAGRALGAGLAALIALRLSDPGALAVTVALVVYLGIALSLLGFRVPIAAPSLFFAGITAGVMGTLTAVGAPPMALLYQHEEQRRSAAMQNAFFFWGMLVSIAALAAAGLVGWRHAAFALVLWPVSLAALLVAHPLARRVEKARIRPWALALAGAAATVLLVRQVV